MFPLLFITDNDTNPCVQTNKYKPMSTNLRVRVRVWQNVLDLRSVWYVVGLTSSSLLLSAKPPLEK